MEKKQIVSKLRKYGIQTILSRPEDLSINVVNKYLELKAKGLI
jgi:N-acetylmuramoyl-L-alanine amidase